MECPVRIEYDFVEKVCEHVIAVARANQLSNRQAHTFCIIAREDIPKVAGWHDKIDFLAALYFSFRRKICISVNIICHLWNEPSEIDRICRREGVTRLF